MKSLSQSLFWWYQKWHNYGDKFQRWASFVLVLLLPTVHVNVLLSQEGYSIVSAYFFSGFEYLVYVVFTGPAWAAVT